MVLSVPLTRWWAGCEMGGFPCQRWWALLRGEGISIDVNRPAQLNRTSRPSSLPGPPWLQPLPHRTGIPCASLKRDHHTGWTSPRLRVKELDVELAGVPLCMAASSVAGTPIEARKQEGGPVAPPGKKGIGEDTKEYSLNTAPCPRSVIRFSKRE